MSYRKCFAIFFTTLEGSFRGSVLDHLILSPFGLVLVTFAAPRKDIQGESMELVGR